MCPLNTTYPYNYVLVKFCFIVESRLHINVALSLPASPTAKLHQPCLLCLAKYQLDLSMSWVVTLTSL